MSLNIRKINVDCAYMIVSNPETGQHNQVSVGIRSVMNRLESKVTIHMLCEVSAIHQTLQRMSCGAHRYILKILLPDLSRFTSCQCKLEHPGLYPDHVLRVF